MPERKTKPSNEEIVQYITGEFIPLSSAAKEKKVDQWCETMDNYMVVPPGYTASLRDMNNPLSTSRIDRTGITGFYLKDPETKMSIDTLHSNSLLSVLGGRNGNFVEAQRVGWEDAEGAMVVSKLFQGFFLKHQSYRVMWDWLKTMYLFGTGIIKLDWQHEEDFIPVRRLGFDETGQTTIDFDDEFTVTKDDLRITHVDPMSFFPHHGYDNLDDMKACAEMFTITKHDARERARDGEFKSEAVERAILAAPARPMEQRQIGSTDRSSPASREVGFKNLKGIEYWGELPLEENPRLRWRHIVILNDIVVMNEDWAIPGPKRLPFFDATIGRIAGNFWGQSPGADMRFQQDLADYMMAIGVEQVRREVQPPIVMQAEDSVDNQKLQRWHSNTIIRSDFPDKIKALSASSNLAAGFGLIQTTKASMKENSGATRLAQGGGLENSRSSAAEATNAFRSAMGRIEAMNMFIEKICLPALGLGMFYFYQFAIESDQDLKNRVGEVPNYDVSLFDLEGLFDLRFVGSRNAVSEEARVANFQFLAQISQIPEAGVKMPWNDIIPEILDTLGYGRVAAKIASPEEQVENLALRQAAGPQPGNGNANGSQTPLPGGSTLTQQAGRVIEG